MKVSVSSVVVLGLVCLFLVLDTAEAGRKKGSRGRSACKYQRKGEESACDTATDTKQITLALKRGDPATCSPTNVVTRPCSDNSLTKMKKVKGCRYERSGAQWSECDPATNQRSKVMTVREGSPAECPPTRTKTKSCNNRRRGSGRRNRGSDA